MDVTEDPLATYREISGKMKKKLFGKKPNLAEGSDQFKKLGQKLCEQEAPMYGGFCYQASAKCEQGLSNIGGQSWSLINAARSYLKAHDDDVQLGIPNYGENLLSAVECYQQSIQASIDNKDSALAASYSIEVAEVLMKHNKPSEAAIHFQRAAELQFQSPIACMQAMDRVASCRIATKDYSAALTIYTDMQHLATQRGGMPGSNEPLGTFRDILIQCEVTRVLLLMLLQPPPQKLPKEHAATLEKYTWVTLEPCWGEVGVLAEDLFLLLQSVVKSCQASDVESLIKLQDDLWPWLNTDQKHILHILIRHVSHAKDPF